MDVIGALMTVPLIRTLPQNTSPELADWRCPERDHRERMSEERQRIEKGMSGHQIASHNEDVCPGIIGRAADLRGQKEG